MGFTVVYFAGRVLRHIGALLLLCWRRMMLASLTAAAAGLLLAEIVGSIITHQIPISIPGQIAAVLFAVSLGYAAALTTLVGEMIAGIVETIRVLEGDAEAGVRTAAVIAERADGKRTGFVGWVDAGAAALVARLAARPPGARRAVPTGIQATARQSPSPAPPRAERPAPPRMGRQVAAPVSPRPPLELQHPQMAAPTPPSEVVSLNLETLADIAATDEFINTAPRPKVNARPVRADQLPRIEWAYEQLTQQDAATLPASVPPTTPPTQLPPSVIPDESPPPALSSHATEAADTMPTTVQPASPALPQSRPVAASSTSDENPPPPAASVTQRSIAKVTTPLPQDASDPHWMPPPPVPVISHTAATARGATPRSTIPLAETVAERNSIWARISRALSGPSKPLHEPPGSIETEDTPASDPDTTAL